jgi:hypothetical protein
MKAIKDLIYTILMLPIIAVVLVMMIVTSPILGMGLYMSLMKRNLQKRYSNVKL